MIEREIAAFAQDEAGLWFATLTCGHTQHMRHRPPWEIRAWVLSEEGRHARIGRALACPLCEGSAQTDP